MDARKMILRETRTIAIGEAVGVALMIGIFALLGQYDRSVLLGGLAGGILAVANFFFMAISLSNAADKVVAEQDAKGGKQSMRFSYALRMLVIFVLLFALVKSGLCNAIAAVLPLVFVRITITVYEFFRKKEDANA